MNNKTLQQFIEENRADIDKAILVVCSNAERLDDKERRLWILNDEGLYLWARKEGVNI